MSYNLYEAIFASSNHLGLIWHILNKRSIATLFDTEYPVLVHSYDCNYGFPSVVDSFPLMLSHAS